MTRDILFAGFVLAAGLLLLANTPVSSQTVSLSGSVYSLEDDEREPLSGANIQLLSLPDSSFVGGTASGRDGEFSIQRVSSGSYLMVTSYLGFDSRSEEIEVKESDIDDFDIVLSSTPLEMEEFQVTARRHRVETRGDTTAYHAAGYQTHRDANVEDLVSRMPGFVIEDGRIRAQGEDVVSVLVDGQEFFGEDAALVLRNLPSEIVAEIEVFDKQSDQAEFTGFRDGNTSRTLNIVTKDGMNRGQFGRFTSGYGSQTRYMAGGNYNQFRGSQRFSLIGMSNNVNQQNFSSEDLLGISEATSSGGSNFRTGGQSGINSTHSTGINYNNEWGDDWKLNASYFFNMTDNTHDMNRERHYLTGYSADQIYDEDALRTSDNYNHRMDMRLEHNIDDRRSLIFTPRLRFQRNMSYRTVDGFTLDQNNELLNEVMRENQYDQSGYNINSTLLYRHRFETRGRTFSANMRTRFSDRSGQRHQFDERNYFDDSGNRIVNDQQTEVFNGGYGFSGNFSYTEPLTDNTQLLVSYRPSLNNNESVQDVFRFDELTNTYSVVDTSLTSRYNNQVFTNRMRASYRFQGERYNANVSMAWQHTDLTGEQTFPHDGGVSENWQNLLPDASFQYRFSNRSNVRLSYRTGTRTPSARQLQDVMDNSDPMRITSGNPNLDQQFDHRLSLRWQHSNADKGSSTSAFVSMNLTDNYIGNRTHVSQHDSTLAEGVVLARGSRLVSPDNIGQSVQLNSSVNRSLPVDFLSSNLNLNTGAGLTRRPSFIDDEKNMTDTYRVAAGMHLSSNISERVDFRVSHDANYNIVENSIRPEMNNHYYTGRTTGSLNLLPGGGLVLSTDVNLRQYTGLGEDFNQTSLFWNGSLGYKFMEDDSAELRMTFFDILGQNDNINRTILEDYIEDYRSNVLTRYVIFSVSYNFRTFSAGS